MLEYALDDKPPTISYEISSAIAIARAFEDHLRALVVLLLEYRRRGILLQDQKRLSEEILVLGKIRRIGRSLSVAIPGSNGRPSAGPLNYRDLEAMRGSLASREIVQQMAGLSS